MKIIQVLLLGASLLPLLARGDVIVYKGISKIAYDIVSDTNTIPPKNSSVFIVIDYETGMWGRFNYYLEGEKKVYFPTAELVTLRGGTAVLKSGASASVFAAGGTAEDTSSFFHYLALLRGTNETVTLRTSPSIVSTARPRALTIGIRDTNGANGTVNFAERVYTVSIVPGRTIAANNAGQTVEQVILGLSAEFEGKGYSLDQE
jgi:hypothetical protein